MKSSLVFSLFLLLACGDDGTAPTDGGTRDSGSDVGTTDSGNTDAGGTDAGNSDAGETDAGTDATTDSGGTDSGTDAGIPDECTDSEDCEGRPCFQLPEGHRVCIADDPADPPREICGDGGIEPCACRDNAGCTDSPDGVCISFRHRYCGGAAPPMTNVCHYDQCTADDDCTAEPTGGCVPRGFGGFVNRCVYGSCRTSTDCRAGGACDLFDTGCGESGESFFCRYPDDVCSSSTPCEGRMEICVPALDGHGTRCVVDKPRP